MFILLSSVFCTLFAIAFLFGKTGLMKFLRGWVVSLAQLLLFCLPATFCGAIGGIACLGITSLYVLIYATRDNRLAVASGLCFVLGYGIAAYISLWYGYCVAPISWSGTLGCASGLNQFNSAIVSFVVDDLFVPPIIGIAFSAVYALLRERKNPNTTPDFQTSRALYSSTSL